MLASWLVSDMYSSNQHKIAIEEVQEAHRTNLRTYALKAAEKVTNLSNELSRLSTYLQQELDCSDYRNVEEELQAKEERLESSIHIIKTLKSVNDTSLSDWQGVIGEELEEQREENHERELELRAALAQMERTLESQVAELGAKQQSTPDIRAELDSMRKELRLLMSAAGGIVLPFPRFSKARTVVESKCPVCGAATHYKQSSSGARIKAVRCDQCQSRLVAKYDEQKGHYLSVRSPVNEEFTCPSCGAVGKLALDPVPGGNATGQCPGCGCGISLVRVTDGVRVRRLEQPPIQPAPLSKEIIEQVRSRLPAQPWPKGVHKEVATDLGIPLATVRHAIEELIIRGNFSPQEDGVVLERPTAALHPSI